MWVPAAPHLNADSVCAESGARWAGEAIDVAISRPPGPRASKSTIVRPSRLSTTGARKSSTRHQNTARRQKANGDFGPISLAGAEFGTSACKHPI